MASQVTARYSHPHSHLNSVDSVHKMHLNQHRELLKRMYMPFVRGPEDRHFFARFQDKYSNAFLKSNPLDPPENKNYILVPHRHDVPIINPCSGTVSIGAEADQQMTDKKASESLRNGRNTQFSQQATVFHKGGQTADRIPSLLLKEINQDQQWNSRVLSDISLRSRLGGWTSPEKIIPSSPQTKEFFSPHAFTFHVDPVQSSDPPSETCRDERARKHMYISTTQSGYEEVPWDKMLRPKVKHTDSTLEPRAEPSTMEHCEPAAEISQVVGGLWDRFQRRSFTVPDKPINFVSPSSRTQHLPLYMGCVGSENAEDLDNPYVDLITYNRVRTAKPYSVKSSYNPNIIGYTGKVQWLATQPVNSNLPPTSPSIISRMYGYFAKHVQPTEFPHKGPLSQIVTTIDPQNSFNKKEKERITI